MKIVGTEIQIKYMQDMLVQRFLIDSVQHLKRTRDLSTAVAQATTAPPRQYLLPVCSIMRASTSHHDRRTQSHWRPLALLECLDVSFLGKFGDCNHTWIKWPQNKTLHIKRKTWYIFFALIFIAVYKTPKNAKILRHSQSSRKEQITATIFKPLKIDIYEMWNGTKICLVSCFGVLD